MSLWRGPRPLSICRLVVLAHAVALVGTLRLAAHEGPPFPILMDEPTEDYVVSVWADPDIGEATFYVVVESPGGGRPAQPPVVSMWSEPVDGRLDRAMYEARRQPLRNQMQFEARPHFDQRDIWNVGFRLTGPHGRIAEVTTQVESTPPGFGVWDLAIYLFPFLLLGGMWVAAMIRRTRSAALANANQPDPAALSLHSAESP